MNLRRAIGGFLLSFVFLFIFLYAVYGAQCLFSSYSVAHAIATAQFQASQPFLANISGGVQNAFINNTQNAPSGDPGLLSDTKSAISIESNLNDVDKVIFERDVNSQLPVASLTKLMTAVVVLDNYNLSDSAVVDSISDSQDSMKVDVKLGDVMPVESFLEIMLVESSNKSAYALSQLMGESKFVGLMNQKAKALGLENTAFVDPTGLSSDDVSTAADLAKLAEYILKNYPKIAEISMTKDFYVPDFGNVENTDELLGEIPEIVCSKTGFTTAAKGCLLLVVGNTKNNDYLINVVLGADDRFAEMKKIINFSSSTCN